MDQPPGPNLHQCRLLALERSALQKLVQLFEERFGVLHFQNGELEFLEFIIKQEGLAQTFQRLARADFVQNERASLQIAQFEERLGDFEFDFGLGLGALGLRKDFGQVSDRRLVEARRRLALGQFELGAELLRVVRKSVARADDLAQKVVLQLE